MAEHSEIELETIEIGLLLEGVFQRYGHDFRNYSRASVTRRVRNFVTAEKLTSISAAQERVLHDPAAFERLLHALTVNVTSMFRDPDFFRFFRTSVVPLLRSYPFIRFWCVGCSTGEEAYSLAILLEEERLYDRSRIYATDLDERALEKAKDGIFPLSVMQEYTSNYLKAGGTRDFSDYYTAAYENAILGPSLRRNMVFAQHNLVTDGSFNEFHVILCRNVLIYFNPVLQARVHNLLFESLARLGILCLGDKESLRFTPHEQEYEPLNEGLKAYRRIR
jgi:chemotaxis protein methyltransferase CheR